MNESSDNRIAGLALQIEALLFALGEPLSREDLSGMLAAAKPDIEEGLRYLQDRCRVEKRGIVLLDDGKTVELRAAAEAAPLIERVRKEAYSRDIGKAGLEALSAIVYRGPLSRSQIDFIRGVNSSQTLRTLAMRGLVRKVPKPGDERSFLYEPTTELLAQLGITRPGELPDYDIVKEKLDQLEAAARASAQQHAPSPAEDSRGVT